MRTKKSNAKLLYPTNRPKTKGSDYSEAAQEKAHLGSLGSKAFKRMAGLIIGTYGFICLVSRIEISLPILALVVFIEFVFHKFE